MAITDIFSRRYAGVKLRDAWTDGDFAFMTQAHLMLRTLFYSDTNYDKINAAAEVIYQRVNDKVAIELGMEYLVKHTWTDRIGQINKFSYSYIVREFLVRPPTGNNPDQDIKSRLSVIEQGFKEEWDRVQLNNANLDGELAKARVRDATRGNPMISKAPIPPRSLASIQGGSTYGAKAVDKAVKSLEVTVEQSRKALSTVFQDLIRKHNAALNEKWEKDVQELNDRLRLNGYPLHFHNGLLQLRGDQMVEEAIREPFWEMMGEPKWGNVDTQMKEAIDYRDNGDRNAPFHAMSALESVIKIISGELGADTGREKSAYNYIDNLVSDRSGNFIENWEGELLQDLFGKVRNRFGHGPGPGPLPKLTEEQTDWAIDTAMSWSMSLIMRMP